MFTAPLHKLRKKEIEILSIILRKRYELTKMINDDNMVDTFLLSKEIKEQIIEEAGESKSNFNVMLSNLRKQNVLIDGDKINKRFIPGLDMEGDKFNLMIIFDINDSK